MSEKEYFGGLKRKTTSQLPNSELSLPVASHLPLYLTHHTRVHTGTRTRFRMDVSDLVAKFMSREGELDLSTTTENSFLTTNKMTT